MMAWPHSWLLRIMASTVSYLRCISASLNMYSLVSICRQGGGGSGAGTMGRQGGHAHGAHGGRGAVCMRSGRGRDSGRCQAGKLSMQGSERAVPLGRCSISSRMMHDTGCHGLPGLAWACTWALRMLGTPQRTWMLRGLASRSRQYTVVPNTCSTGGRGRGKTFARRWITSSRMAGVAPAPWNKLVPGRGGPRPCTPQQAQPEAAASGQNRRLQLALHHGSTLAATEAACMDDQQRLQHPPPPAAAAAAAGTTAGRVLQPAASA